MKKFFATGVLAATVIVMAGCNKAKRSPGRTYMPDMTYSVAYETYAESADRLKASGAQYSGMPVPGTIARGEMAPYKLKNDISGYAMSASVPNPLPAESVNMKEAERLYLVNCAICHGAKLDGNGPLYNGGNGPFIAAPRNLVSDPIVTGLADGTIFHSITYGRNAMGGYGSQLNTRERWMLVHYIRSKQGKAAGAKPAADTTATGAKADSAAAGAKTDTTARPAAN